EAVVPARHREAGELVVGQEPRCGEGVEPPAPGGSAVGLGEVLGQASRGERAEGPHHLAAVLEGDIAPAQRVASDPWALLGPRELGPGELNGEEPSWLLALRCEARDVG